MMKENQALKFDKVTDYLFEVTYDRYEQNIDKAKAYFAKYNPHLGGCSSLQNGAFRGRNYDWLFDEEPEFVIHVPANEEGRHASIGVAATTAVTASDVESGAYLDVYDWLPYVTLDGMNDAGLTVNINVVGFGEMGEFEMKTEDPSDDVCPLMVTRLLLDKAGSIDEAIGMMQDMDIFSLGTLEECHFMITGKQSPDDDTINTVVVELIPNAEKHYELSIIDYNKGDFVDNKPVMTNFHLTGFDGSVESATRHPMGMERYQLLIENYDQAKTLRGIMDLMKKVYYTRAYDLYMDNFWYTEYSGGDLDMTNRGEKNLKGDISAAGAYAAMIQKQLDDYNRVERDGSTWHTVHTSIYDTENAKLYVLPQEAGFSYEFSL
ncbi:MAG: linear amide C-N hydrolase [Lachnospiraceae bacterium]|nr:linear amide C-N hydrolase [Candidatus Equihabitans merdae]